MLGLLATLWPREGPKGLLSGMAWLLIHKSPIASDMCRRARRLVIVSAPLFGGLFCLKVWKIQELATSWYIALARACGGAVSCQEMHQMYSTLSVSESVCALMLLYRVTGFISFKIRKTILM